MACVRSVQPNMLLVGLIILFAVHGSQSQSAQRILWADKIVESAVDLPINNGVRKFLLGFDKPNLGFQECQTSAGQPGSCRFLRYCAQPDILRSFSAFLLNSCFIDTGYVGVCCRSGIVAPHLDDRYLKEFKSSTFTAALPVKAQGSSATNRTSTRPQQSATGLVATTRKPATGQSVSRITTQRTVSTLSTFKMTSTVTVRTPTAVSSNPLIATQSNAKQPVTARPPIPLTQQATTKSPTVSTQKFVSKQPIPIFQSQITKRPAILFQDSVTTSPTKQPVTIRPPVPLTQQATTKSPTVSTQKFVSKQPIPNSQSQITKRPAILFQDSVTTLVSPMKQSVTIRPPIPLTQQATTKSPTVSTQKFVTKKPITDIQSPISKQPTIFVHRPAIQKPTVPLTTKRPTVLTQQPTTKRSVLVNQQTAVQSQKTTAKPGDPVKGCGSLLKEEQRIVGGKPTEEDEWPWMAALLQSGKDPFCGAVLVTDQHVLTAAHCVARRKISELKVRLGEYDFSTISRQELDVPVQKSYIHEAYNTRNLKNDIALLKLQRKIPISPKLQPICLPFSNVILDDQAAYVAGWGTTSFAGNSSRVLLEVLLPIWKQSECAAALKNNEYTGTQICAGYKQGGKDACQGDSGGPLMHQSSRGKWAVVGLVSWGKGCATPNEPGIYTRVTSYLPWIRDKMLSD